MDTLNGGRDVIVKNVKGETETVKVQQLPIRKYEAGFIKMQDEIGMTAFICGKPKEWAYDLDTDSYETVRQHAQEVNAKGFFAFAQRRNDELMERLNSVSPDRIKAIQEKISSPSSSGSPTRPV